MDKKFSEHTFHHKLEQLIKDMVEKEVQFKDAMNEFEKIFIETVAKKCSGNQSRMAQTLGVHRNTLHSRAKALKIKKLF